MREDVSHEKQLAIEMHCRNEPEPVTADVEHAKPADAINAAEQRLQGGEVPDRVRLDALSPDLQRHSRFRMKRREIDEALVRNHTHAVESISI